MKIRKMGRRGRFFAGFLLSLFVCIVVTAIYITSIVALSRTRMEQVAMNKAGKVNYVLTELLYKTEILAALVIQNDGKVDDFERTAATISDDPAIRNVLLAPGGIVRYVYPIEGNEQVIGLDYFSEKAGNKEAMQAKETGRLVLGGPFELIQGGQAMVGRLPVYTGADKKFWGIVSVTLDYPQALDGAELELLGNQGYAYEIWRVNPDNNEKQIISCSTYRYAKNSKYVEYPMDILNAKWYFRLSPLKNWYQFTETWLFILAGLVISILIGFLNMHNYDLKNMQVELELLSYSDMLTGIMNRRGIFRELEDELGQRKKTEPFILCFLDMNSFKNINDKFGHNMGDKVLKIFSSLVSGRIDRENHLFGRIGGDEFIVVFRGMEDCAMVEDFLSRLESDFRNRGEELFKQENALSFSWGYAVYPKDGTTLDELVAVADAKMYQYKQESSSFHS